MTDIELLPSSVAAFVEALKGERGSLDAWLEVNNEREVAAHVEAYARAVAEHNVAARDAEIEALRALLLEMCDDGDEADADLLATLERARTAEARAERLAEVGQAMRDNLRCVLRVNCNCDDEFIDRQTAEWDAALRDHDQEGK